MANEKRAAHGGAKRNAVFRWSCLRTNRQAEKEGNVKAENPSAMGPLQKIADSHRRPRFKLEVDVMINSQTCACSRAIAWTLAKPGSLPY